MWISSYKVCGGGVGGCQQGQIKYFLLGGGGESTCIYKCKKQNKTKQKQTAKLEHNHERKYISSVESQKGTIAIDFVQQ